MKSDETIKRISDITEEINKLPKGYISQKTVKGKVYFYHQWSENGVKKSRFLPDCELGQMKKQLNRRKELQEELKTLKSVENELFANTSKSNNCDYLLMHKRIPVVELKLDEKNGFISKVGNIYNPEHIPLGVSIYNGSASRAELNEWWIDRAIPESRFGIRDALDTLEIKSASLLLSRSNGLSLSDQYWICPKDSDITWDNVNFFRNDFSDDIGDVLFGSAKKSDVFDFSSPDNTSDGNLRKRWKIIEGDRYLIKGGSNPFRQQPYNEVIATEIMKRLGVKCVPYSVTWDNGAPYSVCKDFIGENTELIPAWRIIKTQKQPNNISMYQHFLNCAEKLGIPGVQNFLDEMITVDYIIANEDRHLNNFGAVRNAETLEWTGMAPIYDSGSSLGYDKTVAMMSNSNEITCKPFKKHHEEQLKLVSSFEWVDFAALEGVGDMIKEVLSDKRAAEYLGENRINVIANLTESRIIHIRQLALDHTRKQQINYKDEIEKNIAASYGQSISL